jgi:asparagine synthase (glutamine-hydrolysing)
LDRGFIKYTASIPSKFKNPNESSGFGKRIEKKLLRDSFSNILGEPIIPEQIMYRIKNAFSDACGYDWIPALKQYCEGLITDEEFSSRNEKYPHLPPPTKEAYFYRKTFDELYPNQEHLLPHYWLPNWMDNNGEPSAKVLKLVE